ncbi:MAG: SMP-30/gluconolactonase/LRE family protein [Pseudomonadota bacterium]
MSHGTVFDDRVCALGEGALWHPERNQLFWFDILNRQLLTKSPNGDQTWTFPEMVSAAGWVDHDTLLVGGQSGFWKIDLASGAQTRLLDLEADNPNTRSNDGRADPVGGFWVGTMGLGAEDGAGAIYRYFRGEVRKLYEGVTIPNAICFAPDRKHAYFADTAQRAIWRQVIDQAGWPSGKSEVFVDYSAAGLSPDGAVCDADGNLWVAQWGAGRVACHGPDGSFRGQVHVGASQATCPSFGGPTLSDLFVTSAADGLGEAALTYQPGAGKTWQAAPGIRGQAEHRVVL